MTGPGLATGKIYGRQVSLELLGRVKDQLAKTGVVGRIERVDIAKTGAVEVQLLTDKGRKWVTPGDEHSIELNIGGFRIRLACKIGLPEHRSLSWPIDLPGGW